MTRLKLSGPNPEAVARFDTFLEVLATAPGHIRYDAPFLFLADPLTGDGVAICELSLRGDALHFSAIQTMTKKRTQGWGSFALQTVLMAADAALFETRLTVVPFRTESDGPKLTKDQLVHWYRRNGFVPVAKMSDKMVRKVPRWAVLKGLPFAEALRLTQRHGGIVRPFEKGPNNVAISHGVTDTNNLIVPIPGTIGWWQYRKRFFHDLLLDTENDNV